MDICSGNEGKLKETLNRVFGLQMLRHMILDYAIQVEKKDKTIANIRSCRLVSMDWFLSTSRALLKCHEPVFRLHFTRFHTHVGEILDDFVSAVSGPSRLYDHVPLFTFRVEEVELLFEEHRHRFSNCLANCGSGLVELHLTFRDVDVPFNLDIDFQLPKLKKFKVDFYKHTYQNYDGAIAFIQSVLDACKQLKSFSMKYLTDNNYFPKGFTFPSSITELRLTHLLVDDDNLEALGKSLVPTLEILELSLSKVPSRRGLITNILEKVRKTLKSFDIRFGEQYARPPSTTFRLPLMEKLERLTIVTEYLQLEQNFFSLEEHVPVLSHMNLSRQTALAFRKLTDWSCFPSVTSLETSLGSMEENVSFDYAQVNFGKRALESMTRAFPNLQKLYITISEANRSVLVFIMKEMTNLQHLRIAAYPSRQERVGRRLPFEFWEALLLGLSMESAVALKKCPQLWGNNLENESTVSIRNMTGLQTRDLDCDDELSLDQTFRLSRAVFTHAFFEMPNLTNLHLDSRFRVSRNIQQAWRDQGRFIECRDERDPFIFVTR